VGYLRAWAVTASALHGERNAGAVPSRTGWRGRTSSGTRDADCLALQPEARVLLGAGAITSARGTGLPMLPLHTDAHAESESDRDREPGRAGLCRD
jgi:hypothetical protein